MKRAVCLRSWFLVLSVVFASAYVMAQATASCSYQTFQYSNVDETFALGTNHYGNVVGYAYNPTTGTEVGFLRYSNGNLKTVTVPGSTGTRLYARNDKGVSVGVYYTSGKQHGVIWNGSTFTTVDYPGSNATFLTGINYSGTIVGQYLDSNNHYHGFRYANGSFTSIHYPTATDTEPFGISDNGVIVGAYSLVGDSLGNIHGFVYANGKYQTVDDPYAQYGYTRLNGVNSNGVIVGTAFDPVHFGTAFRIVNGAVENLSVPGAIGSEGGGINRDGVIVGNAVFATSTTQTTKGFIAHCQSTTTNMCEPTTARTVKICSPVNGSTVTSPVRVVAGAKPGSSPVLRMNIWVDGQKVFQQQDTTQIDTNVPMSAGTHRLTVQAVDSSGAFNATVYVTVSGSSSTCTATTARTVTICSPQNNATVSSPVHVVAAAKAGSSPILRMNIWVDYQKVYEVSDTSSIDTMLPMASGTHRVTVQAADSSGVFNSTIYIQVQ